MSLDPGKLSAIILDRDGVINAETGYYVKTVSEWQFLPGSVEAIARLSQAGHRLFVATNQAGIAKGLYTEQTLNEIHQLMLDGVENAGGKIEAIHYCPHKDEDCCDCRKPKPGLLKQIEQQHNVDLSLAVMIGDNVRDLQAALSAGSCAVMIGQDNSPLEQHFGEKAKQIPMYKDLASFVDDLLNSRAAY